LSAQSRGGNGLYIYDVAAMDWQDTPKAGVRQKAVRADPEQGRFLGVVGFEPMVSSGVHQHLGPATSLMLGGSLADYQDNYGRGSIVINPTGTTHDAISWDGCLFVARLEGPTLYLPSNSDGAGHVGAGRAAFINPAPERPPAIDFPLRSILAQATASAGVARRMLFDYSIERLNHRFVELTLWPGACIAPHRVTALTEWTVLAGGATINGFDAPIGAMVVMEPGATVEIASPFGCRVLAWAEGLIQWLDQEKPDLYGF
jgi:ChrR Cupin-like domain